MSREPRILLYESEATRIAKYARSSVGLEIGGDLLGFYEPGGSPLVFIASGPGPAAQRDATHFRQDPEFQTTVFNKVASRFRMFYVGDWHSHHKLGLSEPSGSDDAKIHDLADKNDWPVLYSLIVQTEVAFGRTTRNGGEFAGIGNINRPVESFGLWWNGFQYTVDRSSTARRRVRIEFQLGANPYLSTAEEMNGVCEAVSKSWAHEHGGKQRGATTHPAGDIEGGRSVADDESAVNLYQQICGIIAQRRRNAQMEVDLNYPGGACLIVSDGPNRVTCRVREASGHIEAMVDSSRSKETFKLPFHRGRIDSSDLDTMAAQIIAQLSFSPGGEFGPSVHV